MSPSAAARPAPNIGSVLGRRLLNHTSVYVFAGSLGLIALLVQVIVLTRLLPPGEYGSLAILMLFGGLASLIAGLGVAQGTTISAFVGGDEEGLVERPTERPVTDNKGLLATGMQMTLLNGLVLTGLTALFATPLSKLLTGDGDAAAAVVFAVAYGVLAPAWRLVAAIPRFERRPHVYVLMLLGTHTASTGAAAALAATGYGIGGAMAGLAIGRVVTLALGIIMSRHRFRRTFVIAHVRSVFKRGWPYAGVIIAFYVSRNAELFVLSRFARNADVATYQVAARLALIPGFALSATLMAWGPIVRGPIRAALEKTDKLDIARGRLAMYYLMLGTWVILTGALLGEVLVYIAPAEYSGAARLLPLLLLAATLHALVMLIFRLSIIKGGLKRLRNWAVTAAILVIGGSLLFIPKYGLIGAAAVNAIVPAIGVAFMYYSSIKGPNPLPVDRRRVAGVVLIALACVVVARLAELLPGNALVVVDLGLVVVFPLLLLLTGLFPRSELFQLLRLFRPSSDHRMNKRQLRARLRGRPIAQIELLEAVVRREEAPRQIADEFGVTETELCEKLVAILRDLTASGRPGAADAKIGATLLIRTAQTKRDLRGWELSQHPDVRPLEVDRLTDAMLKLRGLRGRAWAEARATALPAADGEPVAAP